MKFTIQHQSNIDVPGASGLAKDENGYLILGDNSPYLFLLNSNFSVEEKIPLFPNEHREIIPKPEKPDFEAMEQISENEILGFGSGSLSPQRDKMICIHKGENYKVESFSLTVFYKALKKLEIMRGSELNIEAAAFYDNHLYLFNRRKNVIFGVSYPQLEEHVRRQGPLPDISASAYELPHISGIEAGFSGAGTTASGRLIATCAVENTDNAYDDGEVLGSFVGISSGVKNGIFEPFSWTPLTSEAALKVESVIVEREISEKELELSMVTDSDGADSLILKGLLSL